VSSGILRSGRRFADARVLERILFALDQRFQVERRPIAIFERIGAQAIERWLRQGAKSAKVGLLRVGEAAAVLVENGLNARFDFGVAFRRKLG